MEASSLESLYTSKNTGYFECERPELVPFVPISARKILDVGCGAAGFSGALKKIRQAEVWGVELNQAASEIARGRLDKVFHAPFGPELDMPKNYFDCITFNDVLEHILDPIPALELALSLLSSNGVIVASIPNIGHFPIMWKLIVRGEWDYKDQGILDKTHLRFYTRRSIVNLFKHAGFEIQSIQGINPFFNMEAEDKDLWWRYRLFSWLPASGIHDMRYLQFAVVAKKAIRK
ncbi:MAG TPA: class I SAM-dependent methyltransferase [Candidatus Saccharimonadales bacterium]|nr:class I SAM-dependent methyltransferase [Candidatus Saccharimonadales bacterium]